MPNTVITAVIDIISSKPKAGKRSKEKFEAHFERMCDREQHNTANNRNLETRRDLKRLMMEKRSASCNCWSCIELKMKMLGTRATLSGAVPLGF
jgi:hypothetical protein